MRKAITIFKTNWKKIVAWFVFIPLCVRIFNRWTNLAVGLASIAVDALFLSPLAQKLGVGPVVSRVFSFGLSFLLLVLSWSAGEIIVALMAAACVIELFMLTDSIQKRLEQREMLAAIPI